MPYANGQRTVHLLRGHRCRAAPGRSRPAGASARTIRGSASWPRPSPVTATGSSSTTGRTAARPTSASPASRSRPCRPTRWPRCSPQLDMAPAVISGGSGGARVSMLTAARHREVAVRSRVVVDQRRRLRPHEPGHALLRAEPGQGLARDGMEAVVALPEWEEVARAQPVEPATHPRPGPRRSSSRRWSGGCSPTARAATSWFPGCPRRRPQPRPPHVGVPQRGERRAPHPRDVRGSRGGAAERAARRAALG